MPFYDEKNYSFERSLGFLLNSLASLVNQELDELLKAQPGISLAQWRVLATIHRSDTATASSLCAALDHDSGAMTRLIDKLEALDLVSREDDASDRRAYKLGLTRKGRLASSRGFEIARDNLNRSMADLTEKEGETLLALLLRVKQTTLEFRATRLPAEKSPKGV